MPSGDPIRLGTSALPRLVPESGSDITTNEFGVDEGIIRHSLGDQSLAESLRPARGTPYAGSLPQFAGFYVDRSAILGGEGKSCHVDVVYKRINPGWGIQPPVRSHELAIIDLDDGSELYAGRNPFSSIPVPHPIITYRFAAETPPDQLGKQAVPPNAPAVSQYQYTGYFVASNGAAYRTVKFFFNPLPKWLCLQDDAVPVCGGRFFEIQQKWKRVLVFGRYVYDFPPAA